MKFFGINTVLVNNLPVYTMHLKLKSSRRTQLFLRGFNVPYTNEGKYLRINQSNIDLGVHQNLVCRYREAKLLIDLRNAQTNYRLYKKYGQI